MRSFRNHLKKKLKDKQFSKLYNEERQLASLALKILEGREQRGFSQQELAVRAKITQQQLSKLENGVNCNITTFLKVCNALELNVVLTK